MNYTKTTWVTDTTPLNATNMNNIETGLENVDNKFTWLEITADPANAVKNRGYFCDTTGGAFTVTLPASAGLIVGDFVRVADSAGNFTTANLKVQADGTDPIYGVAGDFIDLIADYDFLTLVWSGATNGWVITSKP